MRILMAILTQLVILSCSLMAQQSSPLVAPPQAELGKWWKNSGIVKKLQLSEAQVGQIEQIFLNHRQTLAGLNEELKLRETQLRTLMHADSLDEAAVLAQTELVVAARISLEKENTSMMLSIRKALTKEQWGTLEGIRASRTYIVGGSDPVKAPMVIYQSVPQYTQEARYARIEGIVLLQAIVRKEGTVGDIKVLRGLGYGLDERAVDIVEKEWKFRPGTLNGQPVDVQVNIELTFRLY